ncbi:hypothetical protein EPUS_00163 [Endocarpon pusillum Z07020]|uniref:Amidohydrolase-related domain-containing protein n=1 Tax=Endocarpon pusillum (strain Z07020 / HMAS-L-300199) TaxID=1263415 RepID=U1HX37_ENDPU|nr:uncharacterized protein EPUS_00163 [Endocarpon pusillum Z07020]ERF75370.1 hypothetical protein EPUS_00163 [Endocarpon pusillum Z07020]
MSSYDRRVIIDSHVHLFARAQLPTLRWTPRLPSDHVLKGQNSVQEYCSAISSSAGKLRGFVFIESDRVSSLSHAGWNHALEEVELPTRIAKWELREEEDEGFGAGDEDLVLGIVLWAPVPAGPEAMEAYMNSAKERCGDEKVLEKIKGVRYLVQDKPSGVMLQPRFIESLKWLRKQWAGFRFGCRCKEWRNLTAEGSLSTSDLGGDCEWVISPTPDGGTTFEEMARFDGTFMKLSGAFSELLSSQNWQDPGSLERIIEILTCDAFGPSRIMFGSDWPVCTVQWPWIELSWQYWHGVVEAILSARNLSDDESTMIWSGTVQAAYNIP